MSMRASRHPLTAYVADWRPSPDAFRLAASDPATRVPELEDAETQAQEESDRMKTWSSSRRRKAVHRIIERARWRAVQRLTEESRHVISQELHLKPSARSIAALIEAGGEHVPESVLDKADAIQEAAEAENPAQYSGAVDAPVWALALHASAAAGSDGASFPCPAPNMGNAALRGEHGEGASWSGTAWSSESTENAEAALPPGRPTAPQQRPAARVTTAVARAVCARSGLVVAGTPAFAAFLAERFRDRTAAQSFLQKVIATATRFNDNVLVYCGDRFRFAISAIPDTLQPKDGAQQRPAGTPVPSTFVSITVVHTA